MELNETQGKSIENAKSLIKLLLTLEEMDEPTAKEIKENSWRGVRSDGVEYLCNHLKMLKRKLNHSPTK